MSPKEQKITSGREAISSALSITSSGVTQTGQPGPWINSTLPEPPQEVWPWLVQMGCNRGGWYSWDRLDNGGRPSAGRIVREWQSLEEGQHLDSVPSGLMVHSRDPRTGAHPGAASRT
ncbi:hypothetical protein P3T29_000294 [Kitasatospora sp. MAP5-34]|nr:hypothetical protein [Kitasatospora sp. MAP5-34]